MATPTKQGLTDFPGLHGGMAALLVMVILVGMGEKMAERFLPIYLLALGGGTFSVGLQNGLSNLLNALYSFPGGYLSDRLGHKRALLIFNLLAMSGFLLAAAVPSWPAVIGASVLFLSWTAISLPASMSVVSRVLPQNRRTLGVSLHSLVRRIPMALGPMAGGALIAGYGEKTGVRLAFLAALIMGGLALVIQQRFLEDEAPNSEAEPNPLRLRHHLSPHLRRLLISDILVRFCEQIPYAFVVVWCLKNVGISPVQFGLLTAVEMGTAMVVYLPVAHLADRGAKKPYVVTTFFNFALFPAVLLVSRSFPALVAAFFIRGLKEFGEPTRKSLILDLAPEGMKAGMFGLYYLIRDVIVSVAAFGGAFLWSISPATNLLVSSAFGLAGTVYFAAFGRDLRGS